MSYSDVLTIPNLRHKLRPEVLQRVDRILADLLIEIRPLTYEHKREVRLVDLRHVEYYDVKSAFDNALHNKGKELAAVEKLTRILYDEYHAGHLDTADEERRLARYNLNRRHKVLNEDILVLRNSRQDIEYKMRSDGYLEPRSGSIKSGLVDEVYIDSLIAPYKTPEGAKIPLFAAKDDAAEKKFRDNVLEAYEAKRGKLVWCVVSGQWRKAKHITVFDIVPHRVGEPAAKHLLGPPDNENGHLMRTKNGLPMHRIYAEAFRRGYLVLLPTGGPDDDQGSFSRWKVSFWGEFDDVEATDRSRHKDLPWGSKLDGRPLKFQNQFRPGARYLFFLYCTSVLRRQRYEAPGWWRTCVDSSSTSKGQLSFSLRTSVLRHHARSCHLTEEEAVEFAAHNTFPHVADDSVEDKVFEAADEETVDEETVDEETMDAFLADVTVDPDVPPPTSPLTEESNDSMDAIEVEIDGEIEVQGEESEHWEEVDDGYKWEDTWVEVDEDVDEYADEVEDRDRDIY